MNAAHGQQQQQPIRRFYYVLQRASVLGPSPVTGHSNGLVYFPWHCSDPSDRSGHAWGRLCDQVHDYYCFVEPKVQHWTKACSALHPGEWQLLMDLYPSSHLPEILSFPLRPLTPVLVEKPTPLGKCCMHPSEHLGFDVPDGPFELVMFE